MIKLKPISQKQKLYLTCARICFYQWRLPIIKKNQRWPYLHLHWAHNQIFGMMIIMAPLSSSFKTKFDLWERKSEITFENKSQSQNQQTKASHVKVQK